MSKMSDLDAQLQEVGIDPERVDLVEIDAYMVNYQNKTGYPIGIIEAARLLYTGPQIEGWMWVV